MNKITYVKGNNLDCYGWSDGEKLYLKEKIEDLSPEHGIYLYKAINLDKNEIGAVASNQIIG